MVEKNAGVGGNFDQSRLEVLTNKGGNFNQKR